MADKGAFTVYTATFTKFLSCCKDSAKSCMHIVIPTHKHTITLTPYMYAHTFERLKCPDIWISHDGAPSPLAAIKTDLPRAHSAQKTTQTVFDPSGPAKVHVESGGVESGGVESSWLACLTHLARYSKNLNSKGLTLLSVVYRTAHGRRRGDG